MTAGAARAGEDPMPSVLQEAIITKASQVPPTHEHLCERPTFKQGPRVREVSTGKGLWSAACTQSWMHTDEPVEFFIAPDCKLEMLPNQDCTDPQVRQDLEAFFAAPLDANVANIVCFGNEYFLKYY